MRKFDLTCSSQASFICKCYKILHLNTRLFKLVCVHMSKHEFSSMFKLSCSKLVSCTVTHLATGAYDSSKIYAPHTISPYFPSIYCAFYTHWFALATDTDRGQRYIMMYLLTVLVQFCQQQIRRRYQYSVFTEIRCPSHCTHLHLARSHVCAISGLVAHADSFCASGYSSLLFTT